MTVFRRKDWIPRLKEKSKSIIKLNPFQNLTGRIRNIRLLQGTAAWFHTYKSPFIKGTVAAILISVVIIGGNQYVKMNTHEVYHVYIGGQEAGVVNDPDVVKQFIADKSAKVQASNTRVHMELDNLAVSFKNERAFKAESNNEQALGAVDRLLQPKSTGVAIIVDGKTIAIVKDKETAKYILDTVKKKYTPQEENRKVAVLSNANKDDNNRSKPQIESVQFTQSVAFLTKEIDPSEVVEPQTVLEKIQTGGIKPTKYIVQEGDCVSCIAQKFNIDQQIIYDRNPWIVDDMIRVGDELDITMLQPELSVKTVEKFVEDQEIQYDTIYQKDETMRSGRTTVLKPGKNGMKKATFLLTRINGQILKEELVEEKVIVEPVSALVKKGTKVILGEGSGRFSWPVIGAKLTSSFGKRWGKMHRGVDLASANRNIMASDHGKVTFSGVKNGYGNVIILDHLNGYETLYAHLSKRLVSKGETVEKGEKIGVMGSTGESTGVHLHFEVHANGGAENPLKYLN